MASLLKQIIDGNHDYRDIHDIKYEYRTPEICEELLSQSLEYCWGNNFPEAENEQTIVDLINAIPNDVISDRKWAARQFRNFSDSDKKSIIYFISKLNFKNMSTADWNEFIMNILVHYEEHSCVPFVLRALHKRIPKQVLDEEFYMKILNIEDSFYNNEINMFTDFIKHIDGNQLTANIWHEIAFKYNINIVPYIPYKFMSREIIITAIESMDSEVMYMFLWGDEITCSLETYIPASYLDVDMRRLLSKHIDYFLLDFPEELTREMCIRIASFDDYFTSFMNVFEHKNIQPYLDFEFCKEVAVKNHLALMHIPEKFINYELVNAVVDEYIKINKHQDILDLIINIKHLGVCVNIEKYIALLKYYHRGTDMQTRKTYKELIEADGTHVQRKALEYILSLSK